VSPSGAEEGDGVLADLVGGWPATALTQSPEAAWTAAVIVAPAELRS
jgi:hypothetical protein